KATGDVTLSAADSHVRTLATLESELESTENAVVFGQSLQESFAHCGPGSSSWKTSQRSLTGELIEFFGAWPRSGLMRNGSVYLRRPLVPLTAGTASGLWPTPNATDGSKAPKFFAGGNPSLPHAVKLWPTLRASDGEKGGRVTPRKSRQGGT